MAASNRGRNPSPSPSVSSVVSDLSTADFSHEEASVNNFVKKLLSKRLFLGHYQERRYVENIGLYRDMVVLHKSETELQVDITRAQSKLISFYGCDKWLGITSPDIIGAPASGHCFWTKLQHVAFGFYWFQIRQIRFEEKEIVVRLKVIRPVNGEILTPSIASMSFTKSLSDNVDSLKTRIRTSIDSLKECNPTPSSPKTEAHQELCHESSKSIPEETKCQGEKKKEEEDEDEKRAKKEEKGKDNSVPDKQVAAESLKMEDVKFLFKTLMHNWKEIFILMTAAIVGTVNGIGKCVEYVGNFSLKLMHEVTYLLRTVTPIFLAVIELVGKVVGGLYLLIAMLCKRENSPMPPGQVMPQMLNRRPPAAIQYYNYPQRGNRRNIRNTRDYI